MTIIEERFFNAALSHFRRSSNFIELTGPDDKKFLINKNNVAWVESGADYTTVTECHGGTTHELRVKESYDEIKSKL